MTTTSARRHCRVHVTGIVQGVGFRPFVHRLAGRHHLTGWVRNTSGRVDIDLDGNTASVAHFLAELRLEAPPLARIGGVTVEDLGIEPTPQEFRILESAAADGRQPVPPDVALCAACERELFDPTNRRYGYPFITCTDCGPRYTVIESLPYDRERTTMREFEQCPACAAEYDSPDSRRFHSETNSCPRCGPRLWLQWPGQCVREACDGKGYGAVVRVAGEFLRAGAIVALRGIGGFHLVVDATNESAVRRLRQRKHRDAKPFAIMVRSIDDVEEFCVVNDHDAHALADRARPIVLLPRRPGSDIAEGVAPGLATLGVMLAYSPLHHLLLMHARRPLVMTSGNRSEEPIAATIPEAIDRLSDIADLFVLHDREIESPVDDSVVRVDGATVSVIRRARGFAPAPLRLPHPARRGVLAVGAHLKSTFTLAAGDEAFVSPHLGDLDSLETLTHYRRTLDRYCRLFRVTPEVVARDLHSGYLSTRLAGELGADREVVVQHHHAHIAAVLGEHDVDQRVIGLAFDGTGAGDDGTAWGAEYLVASQSKYERVAHLRELPLAGGDQAVRSPWRSLLGYAELEPGLHATFAAAFHGIPDGELHAARMQIERHINTPMASSMGRLFDAAAAALGVCTHARFEGEAAMRLEALCDRRFLAPLPFPRMTTATGMIELDPVPLLVALREGMDAGREVAELAAAFHESVALATANLALDLCDAHGITVVALGGGVFQNARLTSAIRAKLEAKHVRVLTPVLLPANDGGVSYGQAVVATALLNEDA